MITIEKLQKELVESGKKHLRSRIDLMCRDCIYDSGERGTWRQQVSRCEATECPLHGVRPMPVKVKNCAKTDEFSGALESDDPSTRSAMIV